MLFLHMKVFSLKMTSNAIYDYLYKTIGSLLENDHNFY